MTLDLARKAAAALVEALSDPPSPPPESEASHPKIPTPTTQEDRTIERLLAAMEAQQARWLEAMVTMVQGRPVMAAPSTPARSTFTAPGHPTLPPTTLPPGPGTGPSQGTLSTITYDDDSIPLAPGIAAVIDREAQEDDAERRRALRTEPDVLAWQLEQRRQAAGMGATGPPAPSGSET